ncbi:MAG: STAS domain-containing protein [Kurthia sp.]|uniref:Anti-sigma factor antagonist n=1 Tax=Kurthia zopfii TaxID=1650 RepID=A0A8B4QDY3_9BACL|nr:STAS domain-containing protein [Kurthia zopfii]PWI23347.1 anti-sigma B factor antagonist [Kurthia zopfii]TDR42222.1 anti-sigma B factor antagonist [Kurthia zopfii]GEK29838.1 anti-sigma-B factor antagonist [Kurthia zopfii]STX10859.1 Anti-anti-sigma-B factor [Kurthia zopfii]
MDCKLEINEKENKVMGKVNGEVDAFTAPDLRDQLLEVELKKGMLVELNLEGVSYMDSTGLGVIVAFYKNITAKGAKLKLTHLSQRLQRLFDITGLSGVIHIEKEGAVGDHERI